VRTAAELVGSLVRGEVRALARAISWAEDADPRFAEAQALFFERVGKGWRTGVTGPPGAGKSTLVNELVALMRDDEATRVGVLAIDPSSPFTGGALLGDRIRMEDRNTDPGVFIRSMASRGSHGGMARAAVDAMDAIDAGGYGEIVVETVGVGQAEYDVVGAADTVVVVLCPGAGDGIQAMKAGLLEVADVLVVNKADLPGSSRLAADLEEAVHTRDVRTDGWEVPVVTASAGKAEGVDRVRAAIGAHREHLERTGLEGARRARRAEQVRHVVMEQLDEELFEGRGLGQRVESELRSGATPYDVAHRILASILEGAPQAKGAAGNGARAGAGRA
jgi:LAO/AO transport system kinase